MFFFFLSTIKYGEYITDQQNNNLRSFYHNLGSIVQIEFMH